MREEKIEREEMDPSYADAEEELPLPPDGRELGIERQAADAGEPEREDPLAEERGEDDPPPDIP